MDQVVRALRFLQKGRDSYINKWEAVSIPRGTLQVTFLHKGFDETRRLGLQSGTEQSKISEYSIVHVFRWCDMHLLPEKLDCLLLTPWCLVAQLIHNWSRVMSLFV
ncbi:hypothetical protein Pint_18628 [Pistacia integerrima]|uniref:Uncharacterized protein n=1 Tax=Pistacia integerrima TaxID=434235 RepID=A0ACC0YYK8_9ROSI|nr:hypothetical protein Pint_18628 [Pistacia integerrima]